MRIILIGNGYFGGLYRERIEKNPNMSIVGIVDTNIERLSVSYGPCGNDYRTLARSVEHDAVVICTPPSEHYQIACQALARNKHVLLMKPGGMSGAEAEALDTLAWRRQVLLVVDYTLLYAPEYHHLNQLVHVLGGVTSVSVERHVVGGPKPEGVVRDLLSHDIALFVRNHRQTEPLSMYCLADGINATAAIFENDEKIAHFSVAYNSIMPKKNMLVRVAPHHTISNPRFSIYWDQVQHMITVESQGKSLDTVFRHDPDPITRSLNDFYRNANSVTAPTSPNLSPRVWRILDLMQESFENNGELKHLGVA